MSHESNENETSEAETSEAESSEAEASQAEVEDAESESDENDDEKKDKPKKVKIAFEATMPRSEAVSYFEAIVGGLRSGRLEFRQEGDTLVLNPPDHVEIEVKAQQKGTKGKIVFEIEWSDEHRPLEILN
jgi:amphi-Trp domain-containing protein